MEPTVETPPALALVADILAEFDRSMDGLGVAGERRNGRVLYLALTSRLLARPVSVALKGPSSGGKSFVLDRVMAHFPAEATLKLSGMSEKALVYLSEDLAHRHIVLAEAAGAAGRMKKYIVRTLLSEGQIVWHAVERMKGGAVTRMLRKQGPTGLILTTTRLIEESETETRLLTLSSNESGEQTRKIFRAVSRGQSGLEAEEVWPALQTWLGAGERWVVIPFAGELADLCAAGAIRLRRDFSILLSLIEAHALLHRQTRARDALGCIVAEARDYDMVRALVGDILAEAAQAAVPRLVRKTVEAVRKISDEWDRSVMAVARVLKVNQSTATRRCQAAVQAGFIVNERKRGERGCKFQLFEPMPKDAHVLPTELAHACMQTNLCSGTLPNPL